jgi:hypothetical protein
MASVRTRELTDALSEVDYPLSKDDLVEHIGARSVPEDVLRAIRSLPPAIYENHDEVIRSVTVDVE